MLQLEHISKAYKTGDFTQVALNDVSVAFRDNEFVAILGPSGSGKTTMLNIIGGLDSYDSGDLAIDGVSTKQYKARDWDAYRNNRIGFVFQSYNLIPHQTVLANVELALTLSGISREERRRRATEELTRVGLGEHLHKRPNQLSGGQMQRVTIARALVNNPEILLADEPTGALDSATSVQIMDLLTEIAKDRLVIMVTHNPELADAYATRIVNLKDGVIASDTMPFTPTATEEEALGKPVRRTKMGPLTALSLSFNNLMTKKGRTLMTAFAGSIGIIGIAAILALANGVNNYIKTVEEDTLSVYPLSIMSTGFDMTSMLVPSSESSDSSEDAGLEWGGSTEEESEDDSIHELSMITRMFASIGSNDLASLKKYLESGESDIDSYVNCIDYSYDVTPQIFDSDVSQGVRQINPDTTFASLGMGSTMSSNSLMSMSMSTDVFDEMMGNSELVESQYDVMAGHWPEKYNECVVVLSKGGGVSDFMLYSLGLRDPAVLDKMVTQFTNEEEVTVPSDSLEISYDDLMDLRFKLVNASDYYQFDPEYNVWIDKSDDEVFMQNLVANSEDLVISGIVRPKPEAKATALSMGIYYTPELVDHLIDYAAASPIVQSQLANPKIDVFNGVSFEEEQEGDSATFDMSSLFTVDEAILQNAFTIDTSLLQPDTSALEQALTAGQMPTLAPMDASALNISPTINTQAFGQGVGTLIAGFMGSYQTLMAEHPGASTNELIQFYLQTPEAQAILSTTMSSLIDVSSMQASVASAVNTYLQQQVTAYMESAVSAMAQQTQAAVQQSMATMAENMGSAMSVNPDVFAEAFKPNMDEEQLTQLIMSMMSVQEHSYDNNLKKLGYANYAKPAAIDIYPIDFASKEKVIEILDDYNQRMEDEGDEDKQITYTDFVGTLMESVTTIIDMISYVLIAFVAISLIVSSIMIGVITYISVLERKKEIGILRAIGASKGDVSRIFNAEAIIVGLAAGLLGVGITALCCIPANAIVYSLFDVPNVALLPWGAAVILVLISVFLSFIAGIIPASSASRKDPVEALRSE